jgi:hypothetical protein
MKIWPVCPTRWVKSHTFNPPLLDALFNDASNLDRLLPRIKRETTSSFGTQNSMLCFQRLSLMNA